MQRDAVIELKLEKSELDILLDAMHQLDYYCRGRLSSEARELFKRLESAPQAI